MPKGEGTVAQVPRRRLAAALVGILFSVLAAGCSSTSSSSSASGTSSAGSAESPQQIYEAKLLKDYRSLDRGVLSYSRIGSLDTAATTQFDVVVTDVGRGPQEIQLTDFNGMTVYQQDVPTGGDVAVRMVACENLTCDSESGNPQPVLYKAKPGEWFWRITAGAPGPALITLRADTYDLGSTESLSEEIINVDVNIVPTPSSIAEKHHQKIAAAARSVVGGIETIGSVAGAVVAVGGIVGFIAVQGRKRKAKGRERGVPTQPEQSPREPGPPEQSHRDSPEGPQQSEHADQTP